MYLLGLDIGKGILPVMPGPLKIPEGEAEAFFDSDGTFLFSLLSELLIVAKSL